MNAAAPDDLPAIDVLIVDDHLRSARQLAQLLELWGAASATAVATFDEAVSVLSQMPHPRLVLLDHGLTTTTSVAVALWLAARPSLRRQTCVASYTNADRSAVMQALQQLLARLDREQDLARQLLDLTSEAESLVLSEHLLALRAGALTLAELYHHLYDAHLSKRLSMAELHSQLRNLSRRFPLLA